MIYYLPGCDVKKNHEQAIVALTEYLKNQSIETISCCRDDLSFIQKGDTIIHNCTLCQILLEARVKDVKIISVYEYLLNDSHFQWPHFNKTYVLQHCLRMKDHIAFINAIKVCLNKMNIQYIELEKDYSRLDFCGVWLNNPADPICEKLAPESFAKFNWQRTILNKNEQIQKMNDYVKQYPLDDVIVYCNGCEKGLKLTHVQPVHIIELITYHFMKRETV